MYISSKQEENLRNKVSQAIRYIYIHMQYKLKTSTSTKLYSKKKIIIRRYIRECE